jgi:hypothetical protein
MITPMLLINLLLCVAVAVALPDHYGGLSAAFGRRRWRSLATRSFAALDYFDFAPIQKLHK